MAKNNEIGVDHLHKGHQCENCGEPFGFHELTTFFAKLRGNTFLCFRCTKPNYLAPSESMILRVAAVLFSVLIGLVIIGGINIVIPAIEHGPGYTRYSTWPLIGGAILGIVIGRFIHKALHWKLGRFTTDRSHKSYENVGYD